MNFFLVIIFLFFAGSTLGWILEVFWRRFFSANNPEHKWINPGFLIGPYLPLYGLSLITLFVLSFIDVSFVENRILQKILLFVLMACSITFVEYIAGLIFIKSMNIKLWDYSSMRGNIQGIICPTYTFYWYLLSAFYYFILHPRILNWLYWFTNHLTFCFFVGFFYGVFAVDLFYSLKLMAKIRRFATENGLVVKIESLKQNIRKINDEKKEKVHFWLTTKSKNIGLKEAIERMKEKIEKK